MKKENQLLGFMAKACHYAQGHIGDPSAWATRDSIREQYLVCVSYQMACFLAQNTVNGENGVESDIVLGKLIDAKLQDGLMVKSVEEWEKILNKLVRDLGGWKKDV